MHLDSKTQYTDSQVFAIVEKSTFTLLQGKF